MKKVQFNVKSCEAERKVIVIAFTKRDGKYFRGVGVAKCHEQDTFDAQKGEKIATHKALIKLCRALKNDLQVIIDLCADLGAEAISKQAKIVAEIERHQRVLDKFYK